MMANQVSDPELLIRVVEPVLVVTNPNVDFKVLYRHYIRALSRWPKDLLRPETSFPDVFRRQVDRRFLPQPQIPPTTVDTKFETRQINALYSLLENRYGNKVRSKLVVLNEWMNSSC